MNVGKCYFFFHSTYILRKLFFLLLSQSWSYSEEPLAGSKLLTCVFSALIVAEFIAIKDRVAELLGHPVVLGHQKELGPRVGRTKGFQDKWVEEPGCKRNKRKWGLWEETWALCSGLWAVGVSLSPNRSQTLLFFPTSVCFSPALSGILTSQLPHHSKASLFPAKATQLPASYV